MISHNNKYDWDERVFLRSGDGQGGLEVMTGKVWDEISDPFPNINDATFEVWEWMNYFIPHLMMDIITYPCWDWS